MTSSEHVSFTDRVEALFRQRQGEWIDARLLMQAGGTFAWRTRVSECRAVRGLNIENRQRRVTNADGKVFTVSEYRLKAEEPSVVLTVTSGGQATFL